MVDANGGALSVLDTNMQAKRIPITTRGEGFLHLEHCSLNTQEDFDVKVVETRDMLKNILINMNRYNGTERDCQVCFLDAEGSMESYSYSSISSSNPFDLSAEC